MESGPIKVFYSYSHKDESFAKDLDKYLIMLKRKKIIDAWYDRKIEAGEKWSEKINVELNQAQITLLLISIDFLNSEYCYDKELATALIRHKLGQTVILPIIIRKIPNMEETPFSQFQYLPKDGKPVDHFENRDDAWVDITEGITKVCRNILKQGTARRDGLTKDKHQLADNKMSESIMRNVLFKMTMENQKREMNLWKILQVPGADYEQVLKDVHDIRIKKNETSGKIFEKWDKIIRE